MKRILWIALAATALACPAGSDGPVEYRRENTQEVKHRAETEHYYLVTRPDYRKCMYPLCGGYYVREVNEAQSTCLNDVNAPDCYVAQVDLSALVLPADDLAELQNLTHEGHVLVRGAISPMANHAAIGVLEVTEAWRGITLNEPTGEFHLLKNNGIKCITYPCQVLSQLTLNTNELWNIAGVDLVASGASNDDIQLAQDQLFGDGLIVAGTHQTVTGPAGDALEVVSEEIYLPIDIGEVCADNVCGSDEFCCNPSCGICAPMGGACIEIACAPNDQCEHSECNQGSALASGCSDCVTTVCNADSFCCDQGWDGLCVQQAEELCGDTCEAPPPPVECAHSECDAGAKLDASCSSCAAAVCAADSFCCDTKWDALCAQQAEQACDVCEPAAATCAHDTCATGDSLEPSCSTCAAAVCDADAYCCDVYWDGVCVDAADSLCGC